MIIMLNWALVIIVVVIFGGYLVSGYLHPFRPCRSCSGFGVHRGSVYRKALRNCTACGGKGRFRRGAAPPVGQAFGEARRR
jgi:DnaJ-class molecular chaperone